EAKRKEEARKKAEAEAKRKAKEFRDGLRKAYISSLRKEIERNKKYPIISKTKGQEGEVVLHFTLHKDGRITDAIILSSSGVKRLDKAALKALKKVGVFKRIPKELKEDFLEIKVPLEFNLK
ncbi:MAG: energy transducer TonB, partial [Arcobacter sp.]|nr:energy transducer TonB [Arcobacter sp.]